MESTPLTKKTIQTNKNTCQINSATLFTCRDISVLQIYDIHDTHTHISKSKCLQLQPPSHVSNKTGSVFLDDTGSTCSALRSDSISDAWWLAPYRSPGKGLGGRRSFSLEGARAASHIQGFPEEPDRWSYPSSRSYLNGRLNRLNVQTVQSHWISNSVLSVELKDLEMARHLALVAGKGWIRKKSE